MKQRIVSLCLMLALCLGLLPVTAGAAAPAGQELYVGGVEISATGYWTTDDAGNVTAAGDTKPTDDYIHYDAETNTLTLCNARITKGLPSSPDTAAGSHIFSSAIGVLNQNGDAELTIRLEGDNVIGDVSNGIYLLSTSAGKAGLTITGGDSLDVKGSFYGIRVQSNTGDAKLTIQGEARVAAAVTFTTGDGVTVQSAADKDADLTVDGASLAAAGGSSYGAGIYFYGPDTPSLTVNNSAMVSASGIAAGDTLNTPVSTGGTGGLVFEGRDGTVYGTMKLPDNLTIGEGQSLTLADGATLNANSHYVIVDGGTVSDGIKNNLGDSLKIAPSITTESLQKGTVGEYYTATLEATGTEPISWGYSGTLPAGLTLDASTGVISGIPTEAREFGFEVTATHSWGEGIDYQMIADTKKFTITIDAAANVPVTGVTLDPDTLTLTEGETAALTATITPDNATNKNVTWSSDDEAVATVDADGKVTAKSAGTATITVTTEDGGKTAACEVTVTAASVPVTGVTLNKTNLTLQEKASETLTATVVPTDATNKNVTWASSDPNVATVDQTGNVTAVGAGTATITVTTEDGEKTATCKVTVTHGTLTKTAEKPATCTEAGKKAYYTCRTCGKHFADEAGKTEITNLDGYGIIPATGHTLTKTAEKPTTCTEAGKKAYYTCKTCGKHFADAEGTTEIPNLGEYGIIPATDHSYGTPVWTWAADGKSCTVTFTCKNDPSHTESPGVTVTSQVAQPAGCTTTGTTAYTAKVTFGGTTYQSTTQRHDIPAAGHKLTKTAEKPATCTAAGKAAYYTCETCGRRFADEAAGTEITNLDEYGVLPATGHTYVNGVCTACATRASRM